MMKTTKTKMMIDSSTLKTLANTINSIDPYYEKIDNHVRWEMESRRTEKAKKVFNELTETEKLKLLTHLNASGRLTLSRHFKTK